MRRTTTVLVAALAAVLLVACGDDAEEVAGGPAPAPDPGAGLLGRTFVSTEVTGHSLVEGTRVQLELTPDGRLRADAGCNTLGGVAALDGGVLQVAELSQTEMGCDPARHEQDAWLADLLSSSPAYRAEGDRLVITSAAATLTLVDREVADPDRPVAGTRWEVTALTELMPGSSSAAAPPPGAWLQVGEDGSVTGWTGCDDLRGRAEVGSGEVTFAGVAASSEGCEPEVAAQAQTVLDTLGQGRLTAEVTADVLRLDAPDGRGLQLHASGAP